MANVRIKLTGSTNRALTVRAGHNPDKRSLLCLRGKTALDPARGDLGWAGPAAGGGGGGDAALAPGADAQLLDAFVASLPPGSWAIHVAAYRECLEVQQDGTAGSPGLAQADPRWAALYRSPILVATVRWLGARAVLDRDGDPDGASLSPGTRLGTLVAVLERLWEALLEGELARFWAEAEAAGARREDVERRGSLTSLEKVAGSGDVPAWDPEIAGRLQTMENLALEWSLCVVAVFVDLHLSRAVSSRALLRQVAAMMRVVRVPGEDRLPAQLATFDDFFFSQQWVNCFWMLVVSELWFAASTDTEPLLDPVAEFPSVPYLMRPGLVASVPAPSGRPRGIPVPERILSIRRITCREYLGLVDPVRSTTLPAEDQETLLAGTVGRIAQLGPLPLRILLNYAVLKTAQLKSWARARGLSVFDVLVAEHALESGPAAGTTGSEVRYLRRLAANPHLPEAIRRRRFVLRAVERVEGKLPPGLAKAARDADFDAFAAELPEMGPEGQQMVLASLLTMRLACMLLGSPEPFADLRPGGEEADSPSRAPDVEHPAYNEQVEDLPDDASSLLGLSDVSADPDPPSESDASSDADLRLLELWFATPAFTSASRDAISISAWARLLPSRFTAAQLRASPFASIACNAAVLAAWFHLLVLRRFSAIAVRAPAALQARALELHGDILSDVHACLELLDASGRPGHAASAGLLRSVLEGEGDGLSRADLQILRTARQVVGRCPHLAGGDADGTCWVCAAGRAGRLRGEGDEAGGEDAGDPLARVAGYGLARADSAEGVLSDATARVVTPESSLAASSASGSATAAGPRRVRFADAADVFETYSKEEYPARSMLAADHPEDAVRDPGADMGVMPLAVMLEQRTRDGMPNLRVYWS
ncbi:hypothetical protein DFJ74DRAFT_775183 [Hyaloraphidium curvatum]|nr:hypothetical protein DFJ74DRAFT_775183 [Hyaloraphidium curvatum]